MLIKLILKKIINVSILSTGKKLSHKEIDQIFNFVYSQINCLPSIYRFLFLLFTLFFVFILLFSDNQIAKLFNIFFYLNVFFIKKYLSSVQGLVFYYISHQVK